MGKRADLNDIAYGLAHGFISRNNDVNGYWALGLLHVLANARGSDRLHIDLQSSADAEPALVAAMQARYSAWLQHALQRHALDSSRLHGAVIELAFDRSDLALQAQARSLIGAPPLMCSALLTDNLGRIYRCDALAACRPHNAAREQRSTRVTLQD